MVGNRLMPSVRSGFKRFEVMSKQPLRQWPGDGTAARKTLMIRLRFSNGAAAFVPAALRFWKGWLAGS